MRLIKFEDQDPKTFESFMKSEVYTNLDVYANKRCKKCLGTGKKGTWITTEGKKISDNACACAIRNGILKYIEIEKQRGTNA